MDCESTLSLSLSSTGGEFSRAAPMSESRQRYGTYSSSRTTRVTFCNNARERALMQDARRNGGCLGPWYDDSHGYESHGYDSHGYDSHGYDSHGMES